MDKFISKRNELLANSVVEALNRRHFNACFCKNRDEVTEKLKSLISKDNTVSWGGSVTLDELKIKEFLKEQGYKTLDRESAKTQEERQELIVKSMTADVFLMSANAISQDGELVNMDGIGNRVSALCFGPKKVIVIAGMNKVTRDLESAVKRVRNISAPINSKRIETIHQMNTPCLKTGVCADCKSETSICAQMVITRLSRPKSRINVILVNENLGF